MRKKNGEGSKGFSSKSVENYNEKKGERKRSREEGTFAVDYFLFIFFFLCVCARFK